MNPQQSLIRSVILSVGIALLAMPAVTAQLIPVPEGYVFAKGEELGDSLWVARIADSTTADQGPARTRVDQATASLPLQTYDERIARAIRRYVETGQAPVLHTSDAVVYPFGKSQSVLVCAVFRVCAIAFEPGERPAHVILGDTERWEAHQSQEGETPVLILKPLAPEIETNLIVPTDRRTYHITLVSTTVPAPEETLNPRVRYMRQLKFYYPDQTVQAWDRDTRALQLRRDAAALEVGLPTHVDLTEIEYIYRCAENKSGGFPCAKKGFPIEVDQAFFLDGRTFLVIDEADKWEATPVLYVVDQEGRRRLANFNIRGRYVMVQGRPTEIALVYAKGQKRSLFGRKRKAKEDVLRLTLDR